MTKIVRAAPPTAEIVNLADRRKRQSDPAHRLVQASRVSWADEIKSVPLPSTSIKNYRAFCADLQDKP